MAVGLSELQVAPGPAKSKEKAEKAPDTEEASLLSVFERPFVAGVSIAVLAVGLGCFLLLCWRRDQEITQFDEYVVEDYKEAYQVGSGRKEASTDVTDTTATTASQPSTS